jgi:hypothetical protein
MFWQLFRDLQGADLADTPKQWKSNRPGGCFDALNCCLTMDLR